MTVPLQLRQDFHAASIAVKKGPAELAWSGRLRLMRRADRQSEAYALSDSGSLSDQTLGLALTGPGPGGLWRGEAGLEWNAYRPTVPAGRQFWDRNNVLDSYEGSVIGVFNRETWLLDGDVTLLRVFSGAEMEGPLAGNATGRLGLAWQRLDLSADSQIIKRTSTLLIAFTQEEIINELPGMTAHLLTPDLVLSIPLGMASLEAVVSQAILVSVDFRKEDGAAAEAAAEAEARTDFRAVRGPGLCSAPLRPPIRGRRLSPFLGLATFRDRKPPLCAGVPGDFRQ